MSRRKAIAWLYGEFAELNAAGILSVEIIEQLRAHYGPVSIRSKRSTALLLFSILGAASIGLGIILLLAHNWNTLGRPIRTVLSFMPLMAGQALVWWTLLCRSRSTPWREGSGVFLALAVGACISLISQTYHIKGDMSTFLLTWIILGGPLVYVLDSTAVALLYLAGTTCWAAAVQFEHSQALLFWPLAAFLAPHIWQAFKNNPEGPRVQLLSWGLCVALPFATGFVLERTMPGLWLVVYSGLFCTLLLAGRGPFRAVRLNAFHLAGFLGVAVMTLILTYDGVWRDIGWNHYRHGAGYHAWLIWQDYAMALASLAGVIILAVQTVRRKDWLAAAAIGLPALAVLGFTASAQDVPAGIMVGAFNLYALILGAVIVVMGLQRDELITVNAGMALISMLIILRFFDADLTFTIRGLLFIVLGIGFLCANVAMVRRAATRKEAES